VQIDGNGARPADQSWQETYIVGTGSAVSFPNTNISTKTYQETGWLVCSSTYIESSYSNFIVGGVCIDTHLAKVLASYYASATITFEVFDRGATDTWTPGAYILTGIDSMSNQAGAAYSTITYWVATSSINPPTSYTQINTNTVYWTTDRYLLCQARLSTSNTNSINPYIKRMSLESRGYYTTGFKIYALYPTLNTAGGTTACVIFTNGATEQEKFRRYILSGTGDYIPFPSPETYADTIKITVPSGMYLKVKYTED
jgi:hypothetical protein